MEIKVGGIYRVRGNISGNNGSMLLKGTPCEVVSIYSHVDDSGTEVVVRNLKSMRLWSFNRNYLEEVDTMEKAKNVASEEQHQMKILVTFADASTVAQLLKGDKMVKTANAKCAPDDKFSIEVGAKLALERLFEKKNDGSMPSTYNIPAYARMAATFADLADINKRAEERNAKRAEEKRLENSATLIRKIADHYGLNNQKLKLQEELGELITAGAKPSEESHLVEEMADVSIMIEQMVYLLKKESLFAETREKKLDRQMKRIEEEGYCCVCKNLSVASYKEPCKSCFREPNRPNWERK